MKRLKDRKLKKRDKHTEPKIKYKTLLKLGIKDTKENKQRWLNGEALELIVESTEPTKEIKINYDPTHNKVDAIFLKEHNQSEEEYLNKYYEDVTDG